MQLQVSSLINNLGLFTAATLGICGIFGAGILYRHFPHQLVDCCILLLITAPLWHNSVLPQFKLAMNPQQIFGRHGGPPPMQMPMMPGMGPANNKQPPAWDPSWEEQYPFASWVQDILLWSAATDLDEERQAPSIVLQLGGTAKSLARELDIHTLQHGMAIYQGNGQGPQPMSGVGVLLRGLSRKFAPLGVEVTVKAIAEYMYIHRLNNEGIDNFLTRFDLLRTRANLQGFQMNPVATSWFLLTAMGAPPSAWPQILQHRNGQLPNDEAQLTELMTHLRRQGHLVEAGPHNLSRAGRRQGGLGVYLFGEAEATEDAGYEDNSGID